MIPCCAVLCYLWWCFYMKYMWWKLTWQQHSKPTHITWSIRSSITSKGLFLYKVNHLPALEIPLNKTKEYLYLKRQSLYYNGVQRSGNIERQCTYGIYWLFYSEIFTIHTPELTHQDEKLEQLEHLRSENTPHPPATQWLPIIFIHIRSQVKTRQGQSYKFEKFAKTLNSGVLQRTLHAIYLLKLLNKMSKYEMDLASIVEVTERTLFCPQMVGQTDRQMTRQRDERHEIIIPPFNFIEAGGIIACLFWVILFSFSQCTQVSNYHTILPITKTHQ